MRRNSTVILILIGLLTILEGVYNLLLNAASRWINLSSPLLLLSLILVFIAICIVIYNQDRAKREFSSPLPVNRQDVNNPASKPKFLPAVNPVTVIWTGISRISISKKKIGQAVATLIILVCFASSTIFFIQSRVVASAAMAAQTATAIAIATHYPFSNHEILNDPLMNASQQDKWHWDTNRCLFTNQGYLNENLEKNTYHPCFAQTTKFVNFTYEVTMTITEGDCGGLLFGRSAGQSAFYLFSLCQNGSYYVSRCEVKCSPSPSDNSGFMIGNTPTSIGVVVCNNSISLYINRTFINRLSENAPVQGQIGVTSDASNGPTQVVFRDAHVWLLYTGVRCNSLT